MIIPDGRMDLELPPRVVPVLCFCGCDLGVHIPHPDYPFAWPCRNCKCMEFRENHAASADTHIYILDAVSNEETMMFVRVSRQGRSWSVREGLTNR